MNARQIIDEAVDPKRVLRSVRREADRSLKVGDEVISGTADTRTVMSATLEKLFELNRKDYDAEVNDEIRMYLDGYNPEDFDPEEYLFRLFDLMGLYCPPFTYFGFYEADGSVGCWPYDDMALDEFVDKGVLVVQDDTDTPDWSDPQLAQRRPKFLITLTPLGHKICFNAQTREQVWAW